MLDLAIIVAFGIMFLLLMYLIYKIRIVNKMLYNLHDQVNSGNINNDNIFHQIESLLGIYTDLKLDKSLPPTREWAASPDFLRAITQHALANKPKTVVECSSGVSTLVLARCMQLNGAGHVYSMDHEEEFAEKTRQNLIRLGLNDWATVYHAPLRTHNISGEEWLWYSHEKLPSNLKINMLVIDGPIGTLRKNIRYSAGPLLFPLLEDNAYVLLDDASRPDEKEIVEAWKNEFKLASHFITTEKGCSVLIKG